MKRVVSILLTGIMAVTLTGCGNDITLDKRENELIAEYVAGVMLKYSYDNKWEYTKVRTALNKYESNGTSYSPIIQQPTTAGSTTAPTGSQNNNSSATVSATAVATDVYKSLSNALGFKTSLSFRRCTAGSRYPMDEYAVCISAKDGYKVVAVEFDIKNTTGSEITLNTKSSGVTMKLEVGGKSIVQTASMLNNDVICLEDVKVSAGGSYTAVACFQVPEDLAAGKATLTAYQNGTVLGALDGINIQ